MANRVLKRRTAVLAIAAKVVLTIGLLWLVFADVDFTAAASRIALAKPFYIAASGLIVFGSITCSSIRAQYLVRIFGESTGFGRMLEITLIGAFFSQALITFLSGDAMRIWCLTRRGIALLKATSAILLDRALGIISIALLLFLTLPALLTVLPNGMMRLGLITLAGACLLTLIVFVALGILRPLRLEGRPILSAVSQLSSVSRFMWEYPRLFFMALVFSLLVQMGNTLAIYILCLGLNLDITIFECLLIVPATLLISMLPISIAGWGVRENVMVAGFGVLAIAPESAIAVSILFGLLLLAISLSGAVFWIQERKTGPAKIPESDQSVTSVTHT